MGKINDQDSLLLQIYDAVQSQKDPFVTAVKVLKGSVSHYDWVGIYLVEGDKLVLNTYLGRPTEHNVIDIGDGICGAAVIEERTVIVPDVRKDPRYIACSLETKSEIVVPIFDGAGRRCMGEIDIDSDTPDAFDEEDKAFLEKVASSLSRIFG